ncbi:hypothetical protein TRFO_09897 [Tritrichomonas foetus]|uniref:BRO1 domain-containing protein n=1 Tax=Tritrichomonas foetus TaxID=1144522 RepID=A0A1J4JBE4_9EUKA|nr:hypothetical protein TRFO_09897 [Tritrichomonas foetus]|eukprot:OHS96514.1 hypothetical protein TRFO_09897 [Tritrichomonas foetus]
METSLLFLPFPISRGSNPDFNIFVHLFQGESQTIIKLSQATKRHFGDLESFRPYIQALSTKRKLQLPAIWTDPFNSNGSIPSQAVESEIAATIWNYVVALHQKVISMDASDKNSLKSMKEILSDISACNSAFNEIVSSIQHPVFNCNLGNFMVSYHNYICSYWQLCCILTQKESLAPSLIVRCIEDITVCEASCRRLHTQGQTFMMPVLQAIKRYLNSYVRYRLGKNAKASMEYGIALSNFENGLQIAQGSKDSGVAYASQINFANKFILNALKDEVTVCRQENKNIYNQYVSPTPPNLPKPSAPANVGVGRPLFNNMGSIAMTTNNIPNPQNNYAHHNQFTSTTVSAPLGQGGYPSLNNTSLNNFQGTQNLPPNSFHHTQNNLNTGSTFNNLGNNINGSTLNVEEWKTVCTLKSLLAPRIQYVMMNQNPKFQAIGRELSGQLQFTEATDRMIQTAIDNFSKIPGLSIFAINSFIYQADIFYNSVEEKLNMLETNRI